MSFTILGTGSAVPSRVVTNDDLSQIMDTSDEWITTRTGIATRHILTDETLTDIAVEAGRRALAQAGVAPEELDLIICATLRGDYITPAEACVIQMRLGATCPSFDVNAACSGFVYALDVAAGYFARKKAKKVLVVGCDAMSQIMNWEDRSTSVIFGDGAGAVVLGEGDDLLASHLTTQGNYEVLGMPHIRGNSPYLRQPEGSPHLVMHGQEVYKFAVGAFCDSVGAVMKEVGVEPRDIDHVFPHQANLRIINAAQKKLGIPEERYHINIREYGNMSGGSIPLLLDEANKKGLLKKGQLVVLCAFGGGLTTASVLLRWGL